MGIRDPAGGARIKDECHWENQLLGLVEVGRTRQRCLFV
jgi:hypothetical protein